MAELFGFFALFAEVHVAAAQFVLFGRALRP